MTQPHEHRDEATMPTQPDHRPTRAELERENAALKAQVMQLLRHNLRQADEITGQAGEIAMLRWLHAEAAWLLGEAQAPMPTRWHPQPGTVVRVWLDAGEEMVGPNGEYWARRRVENGFARLEVVQRGRFL